MKRVAPLLLVALALSLVLAPLAFAAGGAGAKSDRSPGAPVASAIATITGVAISPLLGTAAYGAYKWIGAGSAAARAALPWYAQLKFWLPALLIVGLCAAKDTLGATLPPGWKKPLDVLETLENKFSGLLAAGAVVPFAMDTMGKLLFGGGDAATPTAHAASLAAHGFATVDLAAVNLSWLLDLLTVPFGIAVFAVVWLASHAITVLILLSPWGAIDAGLKAARTALLGVITLTATMNPWLGACLSIVVIIVAFFVAGWAFRLTIFGSVFCWEFLTRRRNRFAPAADDNAMFAGAHFPGVPVRTLGRLRRTAGGGFEFVYRPWLWLAVRTAPVPVESRALAVGESRVSTANPAGSSFA